MTQNKFKAILLAFMMVFMLAGMPASATELVGRVVDSMSGQVFPDALIHMRGHTIEQRADASGFFRIPEMKPGSYLLEVALPDGRDFVARLILLPNRTKQYIELDYSRINPPDDDEEY